MQEIKKYYLSFRDQFLKKEEKRFIHFGKNKNDVVPEGEFWITKSANNGKNIIQKLNRIDQIQPRKLATFITNINSLFYKDIGNFKLKAIIMKSFNIKYSKCSRSWIRWFTTLLRIKTKNIILSVLI